MFKKIKSLFGYSINDFASDIIKIYYDKGFDGEFTWDKKTSVLKFDNGRILSLKNMYEENKHLSQNEIQDFIDRFIQSEEDAEAELDWDVAKENIYPRVKTQSEIAIRNLYFRSIGAKDDILGSDLCPLGADLVYELVLDSDVNITTITNEQLDKWEISPADTNTLALQNFKAVSTDSFEEVSPGLYRSTWEDSYDASRIVFPELLAKHVSKGDLVAAIPTRDVLIFTGSNDEAGLAAFTDLLREYYDAQRYISFRPYIFSNNHWDFYYPASDHDLFPLFNQLHLSAIKGDYDEQKELLEEVFEKEEHDVFVASYSVLQPDDSDEFFSWATWSEGVPTYLPKTNLVALLREQGDDLETIGFVKWEQLVEHCQSIMQKTDYDPLRVFVDDFPSDEMISKMTFDEL